jgi:putative endonuclease
VYIVYALYNKEVDKVYIGQTKNIEERLDLHRNKVFDHSYTSRFVGDWKLVYQESCLTRSDALKREKQLKSYQGRQFVKGRIKPM